MQRFPTFLLIVLALCQWGYAETITPLPDAEGGPASAEAPEHFVARSLEEAVYIDSSDYERGESTLKELIESYPQTQHAQEAMLRLLEMYWTTNQPEKAVDFFGSLLAHPNLHLCLQVIHRFIEYPHNEEIRHELEVSRKLPNFAKNVASTCRPSGYPRLLHWGRCVV